MFRSIPHPSTPGISTLFGLLLAAGIVGLLGIVGLGKQGSTEGAEWFMPPREARAPEDPTDPEPPPFHDVEERIRDWDRRKGGPLGVSIGDGFDDRIRFGLLFFAELEAYLAEALERDPRALEGVSPRLRRELSRVAYQTGFWAASLLRHQRRWAEAVPVYERLLELDGRLFGEEGRHKGLFLRSLGTVHARMGDRERGLAYRRRSDEDQRRRERRIRERFVG